MRAAALRSLTDDELFSPGEIARAAGVPVPRVLGLIRGGHVVSRGPYIERRDAIRLVRVLGGIAQLPGISRPPLTIPARPHRRQGLPLLFSGALHAALLLVLLLATSRLFDPRDTDMAIKDPRPVRLVYFVSANPGGGGGGSGLRMPQLPRRAERKAPPKIVRQIRNPVPPPREAPPRAHPVVLEPPKPVDPPKPVEPPKIDPPRQAPPRIDPPQPVMPSVQAPVVPAPADAASAPGVLNQSVARTTSAGPGAGGALGTGSGAGIGEGRGAGLGPGFGGGAGGGPFHPGAGIEPPQLLREVKPLYTDEARKQSIEGSVGLEIVVRRDGSVGNLQVIKKLGAGLDERALDAVRQWRFSPATRQGAAVDVIVEVSVEFKLR